MTSPDAHLPPILECVQSSQEQANPYSHQGAYAIRRRETTAPGSPMPARTTSSNSQGTAPFDYKGGPIPEAIKNSYVQQQLPIRQQSLAASFGQTLPSQENPSQAIDKPSVPSIAKSSLENTADNTGSCELNTDNSPVPTRKSSINRSSTPKRTKQQPTVASYKRQTQLTPTLSTADTLNEDDEDFNFRDRPPSSLLCIQPVVARDSASLFSPQTPATDHHPYQFPAVDASSKITVSTINSGATWNPHRLTEEEMSSASPDTPSDDRRPSETVSVDTTSTSVTTRYCSDALEMSPELPFMQERRKSFQTGGEIFFQSKIFHPFTDLWSDIRMMPSRSDSTLSLTCPCPDDLPQRRKMSEGGDSSIALSSSLGEDPARTSIFLRMQQKREQQRKSIYAYRFCRSNVPSNHHHSIMVYPALLSVVARELYHSLGTMTLRKNDIEYHDVFHGKDAVVSDDSCRDGQTMSIICLQAVCDRIDS